MYKLTWYWVLAIAVLLLLCTLPGALSAPTPDYTTTYTIALQKDGSALWTVEYRTPLATNEDMDNFENYSRDLNSVYLPQLKDLMQRSAVQAAASTSRQMEADNFSGEDVVQTSPTGKFGVVTYSFSWTNFAVSDGGLSTGDAFAGGLYLAKDNTLVIKYPHGYTVTAGEPIPDQQVSDGLVWYGVRSFGAGEPRIVLERPAFPVLLGVLGFIVILIIVAGFIVYLKRKQQPESDDLPDDPEDQASRLSEADLVTLEERIVKLLKANGGQQFQSEIVKVLGMPKSTVSSTLNDLHQRGIIQKVRKGRENLIRLIDNSR
jgi:DNA-binding MarR family transcriptional regulator